jgi:hypothetical protein
VDPRLKVEDDTLAAADYTGAAVADTGAAVAKTGAAVDMQRQSKHGLEVGQSTDGGAMSASHKPQYD